MEFWEGEKSRGGSFWWLVGGRFFLVKGGFSRLKGIDGFLDGKFWF